MLRRIEQAALLLQQHQALFCCPLCGRAMAVKQTSLICETGHCYNLAKPGYVNLQPQADKSVYSPALFAARRLVCQAGFFAPLQQRLGEILEQEKVKLQRLTHGEGLRLLDAGCGEGSHLEALLLAQSREPGAVEVAIGVDLAKESIKLAANGSMPVLWCVGDLAHLPLQDASLDVVLNILSPANYAEFRRVLKPGGLIIKVIPEADYLQEIRQAAYKGSLRDTYSNEWVVTHFRQQLLLLDQERLAYHLPLTAQKLAAVLQMTPLTLDLVQQGQGLQDLQARIWQMTALDRPTVPITIAFRILIGRAYGV